VSLSGGGGKLVRSDSMIGIFSGGEDSPPVPIGGGCNSSVIHHNGGVSSRGYCPAGQELRSWISMSAETWRTIQNYPDLYRFANMKLLQQNHELTAISQILQEKHLTSSTAQADAQKQVDSALSIVDADKILSKKYQQTMEVEIRSKLQTYFDEVQQKMESDLRDQAKEKLLTYDNDLMEQYQKKFRELVRCHCDGLQHEALLLLQETAAEKSREKGVAQIDDLIEKFTRDSRFRRATGAGDMQPDDDSLGDGAEGGAPPLTDEQKTELISAEFDSVWRGIVTSMHQKLQLSQDETRLWSLLKGSYAQHQNFPLSIFGDSDFEMHMKKLLESTSDCDALENKIVKCMFESGIPCMNKSTSAFVNAAPEDLPDILYRSGGTSSEAVSFLSPGDFYDVYHVQERYDWSEFAKAVDWMRIWCTLQDYAENSALVPDARCRLFHLLIAENFQEFGFSLSQDFQQAILTIFENCDRNVAPSVWSNLFGSGNKTKRPSESIALECDKFSEFRTARRREEARQSRIAMPQSGSDSAHEATSGSTPSSSGSRRNTSRCAVLLAIPNFAQQRQLHNSDFVDLRKIKRVEERQLKPPKFEVPHVVQA
ncbi:unnamed protein product, partial [Amoebophrya sp. A25]